MRFEEMFRDAKWIAAKESNSFPVIRKNFEVASLPARGGITVLGLGAFVCFVNGERVTEDQLLPLDSDFEDREYPKGRQLAHRAYPCYYDVSPLLRKGRNTVAVLLGNGWYTGTLNDKPYGAQKLCFLLTVTDKDGTRDVVSDLSCRTHSSFVKSGTLHNGEFHDFSDWSDDYLLPEFDDSKWDTAVEAPALKTAYFYSDCPPDRVIEKIQPTLVKKTADGAIYDTGVNLSGYPVLISRGKGEITLTVAEELTKDGDIDPRHVHCQFMKWSAAEDGRSLSPMFTWFGFRYFEIKGDANVAEVRRVHCSAVSDSSFECDNEALNWLYRTYLHTQLCNMHTGIPSDCPHIERRGYTGDGQLCAHAAMLTLDTKKFYEKWMMDISDSQDRIGGRVPYTAPYTDCGGGPGGWGSAIVAVPYEFWQRYGDDRFVTALYPQMLKYFDYLDDHSENDLVVRDDPGAWCLGDWCTPTPVALPAPFINNYFYIKSLQKTIEIARHIGKERDIPALTEKMNARMKATQHAYFNTWDGNFIANVQGANAFALDIGLGDERTKKNFIAYYESLGHFDTGIFGTDIVTRLLFAYGRSDIAYRLLTSEEIGYGWWQKNGATTFWEYWKPFSRSLSHPMFGSPAAYLFEYVLGIRQKKGSVGYRDVVIAPAAIDGLGRAEGSIATQYGKIEVAYRKKDGKTALRVTVPKGVRAEITLPDGTTRISNGGETVEA